MFNNKGIVKDVISVYNKPIMLENIIEKAIKKQHLIATGDRIGVAVSGGVDSMVLLDVLKALSMRMGFYLCVLHFEHGIRNEESVRDMEFVQTICKERNITLHIGRGDVPGVAARSGRNLEATGRMLRYAFFEECRREYTLQKIAVAHHRDDFAETFLLNLIRGSGAAGLTAMKYVRDPGIIRPMLHVSRREIKAYADAHAIRHIEDSTNEDTKYSRNLIRKEVLPLLEKINPETSLAILRAGELLAEEDYALGRYAQGEYQRVAKQKKNKVLLDIPKWGILNKALKRRIVRAAIAACGSLKDVDRNAIDRVIELGETGKTGKYFGIPGKFFVRVNYNTLIIGAKMDTIERNGEFPVCDGLTDLWPGEFFCMDPALRPDAYPKKDSMVQYINADGLENPVIRTRRPGDRFAPFGMGGTKKLKDWFIDTKIPKELRNGLPLLCMGKQVLWIVGYSLSEALRVEPETKRIYKIYYSYGSEED